MSRKPQATTVVIAVAHVKTIIIRRTFVVQFSSWVDKIVRLLVALCSWRANMSKKIARASSVDFHTYLVSLANAVTKKDFRLERRV